MMIMQTQIILHLTQEEMRSIVKESVQEALSQNELNKLKQPHGQDEDPVLTQNQVLNLLQITAPTLRDWIKRGIIPRHQVEGRIYYFKSEVLASIKGKSSSTSLNDAGHEQ